MKLLVMATLAVFALHVDAMVCDITGHYRCNNGNTGSVTGRGESIEAAKVAARDRAREICHGMVDYVRFIEGTAHC